MSNHSYDYHETDDPHWIGLSSIDVGDTLVMPDGARYTFKALRGKLGDAGVYSAALSNQAAANLYAAMTNAPPSEDKPKPRPSRLARLRKWHADRRSEAQRDQRLRDLENDLMWGKVRPLWLARIRGWLFERFYDPVMIILDRFDQEGRDE